MKIKIKTQRDKQKKNAPKQIPWSVFCADVGLLWSWYTQ